MPPSSSKTNPSSPSPDTELVEQTVEFPKPLDELDEPSCGQLCDIALADRVTTGVLFVVVSCAMFLLGYVVGRTYK